MYYPYFRGKMFELLTIRNCASLFYKSNFIPVLEPINDPNKGTGLLRTIEKLREESVPIVVIYNPKVGDLARNTHTIAEYIDKEKVNTNVIPGIIVDHTTDQDDFAELMTNCEDNDVYIIHKGASSSSSFVDFVGKQQSISCHVFSDEHCGKLYRKKFIGNEKVLLHDGFRKRPNAEYPEEEYFSEIHATYDSEELVGFSDFLTVGDEYFDTGGPPYAVALHITYIDHWDEAMRILHFVSESNLTQLDPGKKFLEALTKLINFLDGFDSQIEETEAIQELRSLFVRRHYPGLGKLKELSMRHHIETLASYLEGKSTDGS